MVRQVELRLAHSPDPDDIALWWPITGKLGSDGRPLPGAAGRPVLQTGRWRFVGLPEDIEALNRRACGGSGEDFYEITAISARAMAEAQDRYIVTRSGASMGRGYGPKLVVPPGSTLRCEGCVRAQKPLVAVPGARTTAFMVLRLAVGEPFEYKEVRFDRVIEEVASGRAGAGLVIHEAQLTFAQAGLAHILDLGQWWQRKTGLPLPLGLNAVRRDLEERHGPGTLAEISGILEQSVRHALGHRQQTMAYAAGFSMPSAGAAGGMDRARLEQYVDLYSNDMTADMGQAGREAIARLLLTGSEAGLCRRPERVEVI